MTLSEAKAYLQTVDPETVEFIKEYKERIASFPERISWLNCDYSIIAVCEGYVDSIEQFDEIYNVLCLLDKTIGSINKIDSIIYFDDFEDLERFNPEDMTKSEHSESAKRVKYEYWTREQLLELKEKHLAEFDKIRSEYVLTHTLRNYDLTPNQNHYLHGIKRTPLDISTEEIRQITGLIGECHDFYRVPSDKYRTFVRHIKHIIDLKQTDIEDILQNLHHEVFCKGCCSTDTNTWRKTFLKFEFYNTSYKFACGRTLGGFSAYELPLIIYVVIMEDLRTNKTFALVSFTSFFFEKLMLSYSSTKRVELNYIKKSGSVYIVSVVARPNTPEDPFFEFFISEDTYNKIIHLIHALTLRHQMKYPLQRRCDAYKTYVLYQSPDSINRGLPIPLKYFFNS